MGRPRGAASFTFKPLHGARKRSSASGPDPLPTKPRKPKQLSKMPVARAPVTVGVKKPKLSGIIVHRQPRPNSSKRPKNVI